jgi:transposase-like protein
MYYKVRHNAEVQTRAIYRIPGATGDGKKQGIGSYFGERGSHTFFRAGLPGSFTSLIGSKTIAA